MAITALEHRMRQPISSNGSNRSSSFQKMVSRPQPV